MWLAFDMLALGLRWAFQFHVVCMIFVCVGYPTQTRFLLEYGFNSTFYEFKMEINEGITLYILHVELGTKVLSKVYNTASINGEN